jgi:GNAT superfamily N-acetyltransferase
MTATATAFRYEVREGVEGDMPYVVQTWGESARSCYPDTPTGDYWRHLRRYVESLQEWDDRLVIAHPPDAPELIWGWAMFDGEQVAWVYVRRALRGIGIARALCGSKLTTFARLTPEARRIKDKHPGSITVLPRF